MNTRFNFAAFAASVAVTFTLLMGVASMAGDGPVADAYLAKAAAVHAA
jgi:hypothetical protein